MTQIKTKEQAEQYLVLIERRGKALQQGKEVILEHKKSFDQINLQIRMQLLPYLFYRIFNNQLPNYPNIVAIWLRAEQKGLMQDLARTIINGDQKWFEIICQKLKEVADNVLEEAKAQRNQ